MSNKLKFAIVLSLYLGLLVVAALSALMFTDMVNTMAEKTAISLSIIAFLFSIALTAHAIPDTRQKRQKNLRA